VGCDQWLLDVYPNHPNRFNQPRSAAYGYCRVSTDMQRDSGISLDERGLISERIKDAKRNLCRAGRHQGGGRPFGWRFGEANRTGSAHPLISKPSEQQAIADIVAMRQTRASLVAIRDASWAKGFACTRAWRTSSRAKPKEVRRERGARHPRHARRADAERRPTYRLCRPLCCGSNAASTGCQGATRPGGR